MKDVYPEFLSSPYEEFSRQDANLKRRTDDVPPDCHGNARVVLVGDRWSVFLLWGISWHFSRWSDTFNLDHKGCGEFHRQQLLDCTRSALG